jgi:hypothetical protein
VWSEVNNVENKDDMCEYECCHIEFLRIPHNAFHHYITYLFPTYCS